MTLSVSLVTDRNWDGTREDLTGRNQGTTLVKGDGVSVEDLREGLLPGPDFR